MKKRSNSQKSKKPTVKTKGTQERVTIGMDLGDKTSRYCMLSNEGEILREGQVTTTKAGMVEAFGSLGRARIAIEVGMLEKEPISKLCDELGLQPTVFYRWQKEFFENGAAAFEPKRPSNHSTEQERIAYLEKKIQTKDEVLAGERAETKASVHRTEYR